MVRQRLDQTLQEKKALEDLAFYLDNAHDVEELNGLASEVSSLFPVAEDKSSRGRRDKESRAGPPYNTFRTPSGRVVLVGKSAKGNDALLREKANKGDLWLHVKDFAGAHVLLPQRAQEASSQEDLDFAAGLAVRFSSAKERGKVEVMVADVKDIGRIRGGLPGQVKVTRYRTVMSDGLELSGEMNGPPDSG
jgi:predicted ribosome quality control (RQC) complex YloA/Tae2 family protein